MAHKPNPISLAVINKLAPGQLSHEQRARVQHLLANPGTRRLLADKFLPAGQRQQRQLNTRLAQPVAPGSTMTERDLARNAKAATQVQYGPQESQLNQNLQAAQQHVTNVGDLYDAFLRELATHTANVAQIQQQGVQGAQGLSTAAAALGAGATQGQSAENAGQAGQASAVRQALADSFKALANQGQANTNTYADTLQHVVGPGQKLQAVTGAQGDVGKARQALTDLAGQKGAYNQKYRADTRQQEFENALSTQTLIGNQQNAQASAQAKADAAAAKLNKYGFTEAEWTALPESQKNRYRSGAATRPPKSRPTTGYGHGLPGMNKYGYTYDEWTKLSPAQQAKARAGKSSGKGKGSSSSGPDWLPAGQMSTGVALLPRMKVAASKALKGEPFIPGHGKQTPLGRQQAGQKVQSVSDFKGADPALLAAALDAAQFGYLSPGTVKRLIDAGYKPSRAAQALGVPTAGSPAGRTKRQQRIATLKKGPTIARSVPGLGGTL